MNDIKLRSDVQKLVDNFYDKVRADDLLGPVFNHVDWPKHLPLMYDFWSSMLLGDRTYNGNPFQHHVGLPISKEHFERWLKLFRETLDQNFTGEKADETKMRAESIAGIFQHRLGLLSSN